MWAITFLQEYQTHLIIISSVFAITWAYALKQGFVSDDILGIFQFSDRLEIKGHKCRACQHLWTVQVRNDGVCPSCGATSNDDYGDLYNTYEQELPDKKKVRYKNTQFNPHIGFPGSVIRWIRLQLGKKFVVIGKNDKNHDVYGYRQEPFRHHLINLIIQLSNSYLAYFMLSKLFGGNIALMATLLFIVHPISCQAVAWCSGIGYLMCMFWSLVTFNLVLYVDHLHSQIYLVSGLVSLASMHLFSGSLAWVILLYFQKWVLAGISFLVFLVSFKKIGMGIVKNRSEQFKLQNMGKPTQLNFRKPIVMVKTLFYYICMTVFPKSLGLFHVYGYHFEDGVERTDRRFWGGLVSLALLGYAFYISPEPVRFGLLWWFLYVSIFSNFITAMQFLADRYVYMSTLGYSVIVAFLLRDYPALYGFLIGAYMVRTWMHLPTYKDEIAFYRSNAFNFPKSEVALGNLGVTYINNGMAGSAIDSWLEAIKINPLYDVPHFNLYSVFRNNGMVMQAYDHLKKCLDAKTVHFNKEWANEKLRCEEFMKVMRPLNEYTTELNKKVGGNL